MQSLDLTHLFCNIDDFCQTFIPKWESTLLENGQKKCNRKRSVTHSEMMPLVICYHRSGYRTFKWFYQNHVRKRLNRHFQSLPSYGRFIELMPEILIPLTAFMQSRCHSGEGIAFIDATPLACLSKLTDSTTQNIQRCRGA